MSRMADPDIFKKIKNGDDDAFSHLFDEYYVSLCFFANKYVSDLDLSRSLVQQVFVDLWTKREKLNIHYSPKSYLFHSVKNRSIDYLRKRSRSVSVAEFPDNNLSLEFHDLVEEAELNERINTCIDQLSERCREIFILCRFEGLKYSEIAERLNISVKTVEMHMGIALKKIRNKLSDYQMINLLAFVCLKKS